MRLVNPLSVQDLGPISGIVDTEPNREVPIYPSNTAAIVSGMNLFGSYFYDNSKYARVSTKSFVDLARKLW